MELLCWRRTNIVASWKQYKEINKQQPLTGNFLRCTGRLILTYIEWRMLQWWRRGMFLDLARIVMVMRKVKISGHNVSYKITIMPLVFHTWLGFSKYLATMLAVKLQLCPWSSNTNIKLFVSALPMKYVQDSM